MHGLSFSHSAENITSFFCNSVYCIIAITHQMQSVSRPFYNDRQAAIATVVGLHSSLSIPLAYGTRNLSTLHLTLITWHIALTSFSTKIPHKRPDP